MLDDWDCADSPPTSVLLTSSFFEYVFYIEIYWYDFIAYSLSCCIIISRMTMSSSDWLLRTPASVSWYCHIWSNWSYHCLPFIRDEMYRFRHHHLYSPFKVKCIWKLIEIKSTKTFKNVVSKCRIQQIDFNPKISSIRSHLPGTQRSRRVYFEDGAGWETGHARAWEDKSLRR